MTMPDEIFIRHAEGYVKEAEIYEVLTFATEDDRVEIYHHDRIVTALLEENERLREALRFYSALPDSVTGYRDWFADNGQRAREALGEKNDPQ